MRLDRRGEAFRPARVHLAVRMQAVGHQRMRQRGVAAQVGDVDEGDLALRAFGRGHRIEFIDLLDKGNVDIAQPDIGRVGGITEAMRVCHLAQDRGKQIVPHCWKSGIGLAATAHLAAATPNCPMIEFLPAELCDSALRTELVNEPLTMTDGLIALPDSPGLGIELNLEAVKKYEVD